MIPSSENRVIYRGNGETTAFDYTFKIFDATDIKVLLVKADGTRGVLTSDYYVDMNASKVYYPGYAPGAAEPDVDTPEKLQEGDTLVIYRDVPINQLDKMPEQWPFDVNEKMHDKSCVIDQQLADAVDRSLKFDVDLGAEFNPTLPIQAGYGWRVSDDGKSIVPIKDSEVVLRETEKVYEQAVAETNAIKAETENIKNQTQSISDVTAGYMNGARDFRDGAQQAFVFADAASNLAERWAQAIDSPDYQEGNKSSKSWAEIAQANAIEAGAQADRAKALAAEAKVYDDTITYQPGQVVMTADGATYRCIAESTGENPISSSKWVMVTIIISDTFEQDINGDLMPLLNPKSSDQFEIDAAGDIMPGL